MKHLDVARPLHVSLTIKLSDGGNKYPSYNCESKEAAENWIASQLRQYINVTEYIVYYAWYTEQETYTNTWTKTSHITVEDIVEVDQAEALDI